MCCLQLVGGGGGKFYQLLMAWVCNIVLKRDDHRFVDFYEAYICFLTQHATNPTLMPHCGNVCVLNVILTLTLSHMRGGGNKMSTSLHQSSRKIIYVKPDWDDVRIPGGTPIFWLKLLI